MDLRVFFIILFARFNGISSQSVDMTIQNQATGPDVVQAVVDKIKDSCIYSNDRLFLRRLAYVESQDGLDKDTFRSGYYGGIWQVNKIAYEATKQCNSSQYLFTLCEIISSKLKIDWDRTRWQDLTKPLYSGLAASLYLNLRAGNNTPGDINAQAGFWSHYYHLGLPKSDFFSRIKGLNDDVCEQNAMDIVFVVDSSGSIGIINFILMLDFLQNVTDKVDVGPDSVHVGMISFESSAQVEFLLTRYQTRYEVKKAISNVNYLNGGTDISSGIRAARKYVFSEAYGGRKNAVKVMILLTDGQSYYNATFYEAMAAHKEGINIFVIGVGSVNSEEINAAASDPDCTHVFLLSSFNEMDSLIYQIQKSACRAVLQITPLTGNNDTANGGNATHPELSHTINKPLNNKTSSTTVAINQNNNISNGTGIVTEVICGIVHVYTSYKTPHPGPAVHEAHSVATDGHPSVLYVNSSRDGKPLYITYVGTKLPSTTADITKCNDSSYKVTFTDGPPKGKQVVCQDENGAITECTKTDLLLNPKFSQWMCSDQSPFYVPNPCTVSAISEYKLFHPYPNDKTKFIRCDLKGKMYITLCPSGERYYQGAQTCGNSEEQTNGGKTLLESSLHNPCTEAAILSGKMFFDYPKRKHMFIHCDVWGHAWVMQCPPGEIWHQNSTTCVVDSINQDGKTHSTTNPCTKDDLDKNELFFPLPNRTLFIHCDLAGHPWVQSCGIRQVFDATSSTCVYDISPFIG